MNRHYTSLQHLMTGAFLACLFLTAPAFAALSEDKSAAVIFMYQRIGEDTVPQSNISIEQFREHINELVKGGYSVQPLTKIVDAIKNGKPLPPKTIGITFERAYQTTLANAVPLLEKAKMPFTVFFSPDAIDGGLGGYMTWNQIKSLKGKGLAAFGILPASSEHLVGQTEEKNAALINRAVSRYSEMLRERPPFFSYPYGEISRALRKQVSGYDFRAAFGQQSGVVYGGSNFMDLPRFSMTGEYSDFDRFMLTAHALPLPVSDIVPDDKSITDNPPLVGFTVTPDINNLSKLSCFASGVEGKLPLTRIGGNRVEIRLPQPFTDRRTRINCTVPNDAFIPGEAQSWRWFGLMLTLASLEEDTITNVPEEAGSLNSSADSE
jgi:hypothetical protein